MKVLIADDHGLFREGLRHVLAGLGEPIEVLEAADCDAALSLAAQSADLDLVLLDLNMPGMDGFAALEHFSERYPALPVVILSAATRRSEMQRALDLGAMGFIPKDSTGSVMIQALRLVLAGGIYVPPALAQTATGGQETTGRFTERQRQVLTLLVQGLTNKEIARSLELAEATVKMHVTAIMKILDVSNRTQAVLAAERLELV
ncbi:MAG TPA: response regulator transcription factor [Gammaproteobacteria bacterium]